MPTADVRAWMLFLDAYDRWPITELVARRAGKYRYDFGRRGDQISTPDALIAAVARDQSAVLVTRNVSDFPMTDIQIVAL